MRSKYGVGDAADRTYDGIVFDSKLEMRYYIEEVLPKVASGEIVEYELQKTYILQPKFKHNNKTVLPITYVADFYMKFKDGREIVVDTKGFPDQKAPMKRKMFWYLYPEIELVWMKYVKKYGGWITDDEYKHIKRAEKK